MAHAHKLMAGLLLLSTPVFADDDPRALAEAGWKDKIALNGKLVDGRYHGLGISCFIEGGGSGPRETARIDVEHDGSISVYVGSSAVGQGIETIMAQIAADALELPLERIKVFHGSTTYLRDGVGEIGRAHV